MEVSFLIWAVLGPQVDDTFFGGPTRKPINADGLTSYHYTCHFPGIAFAQGCKLMHGIGHTSGSSFPNIKIAPSISKDQWLVSNQRRCFSKHLECHCRHWIWTRRTHSNKRNLPPFTFHLGFTICIWPFICLHHHHVAVIDVLKIEWSYQSKTNFIHDSGSEKWELL